MALTLIEAGKLTQDLLLRGVIETIVSESQVLQYLPFMDVTGNGITCSTATGRMLRRIPVARSRARAGRRSVSP